MHRGYVPWNSRKTLYKECADNTVVIGMLCFQQGSSRGVLLLHIKFIEKINNLRSHKINRY
jgi:hypothetical protein